jgi:hypothetical protein
MTHRDVSLRCNDPSAIEGRAASQRDKKIRLCHAASGTSVNVRRFVGQNVQRLSR